MNATIRLTASDYQHLARCFERWVGHCITIGEYAHAEFYRDEANTYARLAAKRLPKIAKEISQ